MVPGRAASECAVEAGQETAWGMPRGGVPPFSMPPAHPGAGRNGGMLLFFTNTVFIDNAIGRVEFQEISPKQNDLQRIAKFSLRSFWFADMLKRNHSTRSGT